MHNDSQTAGADLRERIRDAGPYEFPLADSARAVIRPHVRLLFVLFPAAFLALALVFPLSVGSVGFVLAVTVFSSLNWYRWRLRNDPIQEGGETDAPEEAIDTLPSFTIIIPLKNEGRVVHRTFDAVRALEYPAERIQVLVTVEDNDALTHATISSYDLPRNFHVVRIPCRPPFTKGRALQHALPLARGKYLTILDAESRPEKYQLLKAARVMETADGPVCAQAVIKIENKNDNIITRWFAAEYIEWFYKHQRRLVQEGMPLGLAGNSFYLSTELLRSIGGWDMYNVTEDADLAVRLVERGVRFEHLNSVTFEPCPRTLDAWVKQRVRWNKGLMVTKLLHLSKPGFGFKTFNRAQWYNFWYRMLCGGLVPYAFLFTLITGTWIAHFGADWHLTVLNVLMIGNLLVSFVVAYKTDGLNMRHMGLPSSPWRLTLGILCYWTMFLWAGLRAYAEYVLAPLRWHKTDHDILVDDAQAETTQQQAATAVTAVS